MGKAADATEYEGTNFTPNVFAGVKLHFFSDLRNNFIVKMLLS